MLLKVKGKRTGIHRASQASGQENGTCFLPQNRAHFLFLSPFLLFTGRRKQPFKSARRLLVLLIAHESHPCPGMHTADLFQGSSSSIPMQHQASQLCPVGLRLKNSPKCCNISPSSSLPKNISRPDFRRCRPTLSLYLCTLFPPHRTCCAFCPLPAPHAAVGAHAKWRRAAPTVRRQPFSGCARHCWSADRRASGLVKRAAAARARLQSEVCRAHAAGGAVAGQRNAAGAAVWGSARYKVTHSSLPCMQDSSNAYG